jgi:hypothetical protein
MKARGFTALELALVLSISPLVLGGAYLLWRGFDRQHRIALFEAEAARGMRALSEDLRRDLRTLRWEATGLSLTTRAADPAGSASSCNRVEYAVDNGVLVRRGDAGCGPTRAVASSVESAVRTGGTVEVIFAARLAPDDATRVRFLVGGLP